MAVRIDMCVSTSACIDAARPECTDMCMDTQISMCVDRSHAQVYKHALYRCLHMCIGVCVNMCVDMRVDMCIDMCVPDMSTNMRLDMCRDMRAGMCTDMRAGMCSHILWSDGRSTSSPTVKSAHIDTFFKKKRYAYRHVSTRA